MKELVCNYALVRFLPYRETGEFVNFGVLVYAPEVNYFDFRLPKGRNRRVRAFFPELDQNIYRAAVESLRVELERFRGRFGGLFGGDRNLNENMTAFRSLLRRRESLIHFAEPGMRLGVPDDVLNALYNEYVLRSFAQTVAYQETVMRNRLGTWLEEWGLRKRYRANRRVGDDMFHITLPFVQFDDAERPIAALKPLHLNREEPTDVYDHGDIWVQRFRRLAQRGRLPTRMIVPVQLPSGKARVAADQVLDELRNTGVKTADFNDAARIHELASGGGTLPIP